MDIKATTRKWGNSIAVVIPKELVESQHIHEDEEVTITVERKKPRAGELFGRFPELKKIPTQQLKDEARQGWETASDRRRWRK